MVVPAVTAAVGLAAGALARPAVAKRLRPTRKVMGVSMPSAGPDLTKLSKQVGKAAKQFGRLASEVNQARTQAEKVGKALS